MKKYKRILLIILALLVPTIVIDQIAVAAICKAPQVTPEETQEETTPPVHDQTVDEPTASQ